MSNIRLIEGELLDYYDAQEKMQYINNEINKYKNHEEGRKNLDTLFIEMTKYFRDNYRNRKVLQNEYWYNFFEVLSNILHSIAICYAHLNNSDRVADFATMSANITMISGEAYENKIETLGNLITWAYNKQQGIILSVDPREILRENDLNTMNDKFEHYYNSVTLPD